MSKGFAWIGRSIVLGALLAGSFDMSGAIAGVAFSIKNISKEFSRRSTIPILLPSEELLDQVKSRVGSGETLYSNYGIDSNGNSYNLEFNNAPGSVGNAAFRFKFTAVKNGDYREVPQQQNPRYSKTNLIDGSPAQIVAWCGGTACWSIVEWKKNNVLYSVTSKLRKPDTAIEIANSAIQIGDRRVTDKSSISPISQGDGTIESLPDGVYYYKENGAGKFKTYFLFRKRNNQVIGEVAGGGGGSCFAGSANRNTINNNITSYQVSKAEWVFGKVGRYDLNNFSNLELSLYSERLGGPSDAIQRCEKSLAHLVKQNSSVEIAKPEIVQDNSLGSDSDRVRVPIAPPPSKNITSRPPTQQDLALLDRTIQDDRSKVQIADRSKIRNNVNNFLKPFAGGWVTADNQKYYVYPSTKKDRQACILVENGSSQELQIGVANGNSSGTDLNVGNSRMFKTQDSNALALRSPDSEALIPLYSSITNAEITPGNLEMMQQNGCMTSFPGVPKGSGAIAAKPPVQPL